MRDLNRRGVIGLVGGAVAWPVAARAQQTATPAIGWLEVGRYPNELVAFRRGLSEQGYIEGDNVTIELAEAQQYDQLPALAAELARRRVAVIVTSGTINAAQAARAATSMIPIVFSFGGDPVRLGVVASLARPGGNMTGVTYLTAELGPKRLELLRELLPQATTIALLTNPDSASSEPDIANIQAKARNIGQRVIVLKAQTASAIDAAFASLVEQGAGGLLVSANTFFMNQREQLITLAARHKIPSVYYNSAFAAAGGLMSYSDDRNDSFRQVGPYVGRILKGEKPGDLPVMLPVKFEFVINHKTAKTLGITFPPSFELRATDVIE
jgi:putative ABC transport system substrate-binding protein